MIRKAVNRAVSSRVILISKRDIRRARPGHWLLVLPALAWPGLNFEPRQASDQCDQLEDRRAH